MLIVLIFNICMICCSKVVQQSDHMAGYWQLYTCNSLQILKSHKPLKMVYDLIMTNNESHQHVGMPLFARPAGNVIDNDAPERRQKALQSPKAYSWGPLFLKAVDCNCQILTIPTHHLPSAAAIKFITRPQNIGTFFPRNGWLSQFLHNYLYNKVCS